MEQSKNIIDQSDNFRAVTYEGYFTIAFGSLCASLKAFTSFSCCCILLIFFLGSLSSPSLGKSLILFSISLEKRAKMSSSFLTPSSGTSPIDEDKSVRVLPRELERECWEPSGFDDIPTSKSSVVGSTRGGMHWHVDSRIRTRICCQCKACERVLKTHEIAIPTYIEEDLTLVKSFGAHS
jgi:hypothetical protein